MRGHPGIYLLAVALAAGCFSASAGAGCDTNAQKRLVVGPKPTADVLYAHLHEVDMGAWDDGFSEETFTYIGEVHTKAGKTYKIGYLSTEWGEACRATNRLYIFDGENRPLGHYYGIGIDPRKIIINGTTLKLPLDPNSGNTLDLENGPPKEAWLDGDNPEWNPVAPKGTLSKAKPVTASPPPATKGL